MTAAVKLCRQGVPFPTSELCIVEQVVIGHPFPTTGPVYGSRDTLAELSAFAGMIVPQVTPFQQPSVQVRIVPIALYQWATSPNANGSNKARIALQKRITRMFEACLSPTCKKFASFMHAFFTVAWGAPGSGKLCELLQCFPESSSELRRIEISRTINTSIDSILNQVTPELPAGKYDSLDDNARISFNSPCTIHFAGQGRAAQHGFDSMLYQPRFKDQAPLMVLFEYKWSAPGSNTKLRVPDLQDKVRLTVQQLARLLPGT